MFNDLIFAGSFRLVFLTSLCLALCSCDNTRVASQLQDEIDVTLTAPQPPKHIWERIANNFQLHDHHNHPQVQKFVKKYTTETYHIKKVSSRSKPFIYHIADTIDQHDLPSEIALLPMVESAFVPHARSKKGAAGIWQFGRITGSVYGLQQDPWLDARLDLHAATEAAVKHLQFLHKKYDGDWLIALAAYNAGHVRVNRAINKNKKAGKPTDYWSLPLPRETREFVPKILAMAHIVSKHEEHFDKLGHVENKPYFTRVSSHVQLDMIKAAELAEISVRDVRNLNPSYILQVTHPNGPHELFLPIETADKFMQNLAIKSRDPRWRSISTHTVQSGDNLTLIAKRYKTTIAALKLKNKLRGDFIKPGQKLMI